MKRAVHQFVPRFEPGAVGAAIRDGRAALRAAGHASEVFADEVDERFAALGAIPASRYDGAARPGDIRGDVIVYHLAIGATMAERLRIRSERLVVAYHNVTPAAFLEPWDPGLGPAVTWGRRQLVDLAPRAALGIGDSVYSERELIDAGYTQTTTVPVLFDPKLLTAPDPDVVARLAMSKRGTDWLFVSRVAPNKAQHDIVRAFALYRRSHDPSARLWLPGASASDRYSAALRGYVEALGLVDAVGFPGDVAPETLAAYYAAADVFVCLSDHEGFGVPLLEAWGHGLPVVAYAAAAVPETAGDAALLLPDKSAATVAAAVARVVDDEELRAHLVHNGRRRLTAEFDPASVRARFVAAIESVS